MNHTKCPSCGSTEIEFNPAKAKLICTFCKYELEDKPLEQEDIDIHSLHEEIISPGAANMIECDSLITVKCSGCGSEVTIDSENATQAKCHWCRQTLSLNNPLPNGTIPDMILPFSVSKSEAVSLMKDFIKARKHYAKRGFKKSFKDENIIGVYIPYMIVDVNSHIHYDGEGEKTTVRYKKDIEGAFDAKLYSVSVDYDMVIKDLVVESSLNKLYTQNNTNNIINSLLPFDIENAVKWDANYVKDYNIEKRDANILDIKPTLIRHLRCIASYHNIDLVEQYSRGVRWDNRDIDLTGTRWKSLYLPLWLYTYTDVEDGVETTHYLAVNGRTKETMGSIPYHKSAVKINTIISVLFWIIVFFIFPPALWFCFIGIVISLLKIAVTKSRYRNEYSRHRYEEETEKEILNMQQVDTYIKDLTGLNNSRMKDENYSTIYYEDAL